MFTIIFDKNTNRAIGTGQYSHQAILDENEIECTENQYNNFSDYILNGDKIVKSIKEVDLNEVKTNLKRQIDQDAETERLKYITDGVGQSMTYQEKVNQAAAYSKAYYAHQADPENNPEPNENEYLLLASGLGIDGDTLVEAAETVTFAYAQWQRIGAAIEGVRLQSKQAIDAAKTAEEAQAAYNGIKWPNPGAK